MQAGHSNSDKPVFSLCSTIHARSHSLAWFQSPRLFAFAPSPDCLVAFTPPSSAAAKSALLRASRYWQWQFPAQGGGGRCSPWGNSIRQTAVYSRSEFSFLCYLSQAPSKQLTGPQGLKDHRMKATDLREKPQPTDSCALLKAQSISSVC